MKKLLSVLLAVLMLLSMATVAMADGEKTNTTVANGGAFTLKKIYTGSEFAPKEEFRFDVERNTDNPTATDFTDTVTVTHDPDATLDGSYGKITVQLPTYKKVGTYKYTITEKDSTTKGLKKDSNTYTLVVQVINDATEGHEGKFTCQVFMYKGTNTSDKVEAFENTYEYGKLSVSKTVDGWFDAEKNASYTFSIALDENTVNNVTYVGYRYTTDAESGQLQKVDDTKINIIAGTTTNIEIKNGQTLVFDGLPVEAKYVVKETSAMNAQEGHNGVPSTTYNGQVMANGASGVIKAGETSTVAVVNKFEYTGKLVIEKKVTGSFGDMVNDQFTFTVTGVKVADFDAENSTAGVSAVAGENGTVTVTLKHGQKAVFKNLPYGTNYTVSENSVEGYKSTDAFNEYDSNDNKIGSDTTSTIIDQATEEHVFTNDKDQNIETGVSLDTLPYVLVLALAGAGLVLMIARKRRVED